MSSAIVNMWYSHLPDAPPQNASFMILQNFGDRYAQQVKLLPSGRMLARYTNDTGRVLMARYPSNGTPDFSFQYNEQSSEFVIIPDGGKMFVIQGSARWIPVRYQDEALFRDLILQNDDAVLSRPEENENSIFAGLSEESFFSSPYAKIGAAVLGIFIVYKLIN